MTSSSITSELDKSKIIVQDDVFSVTLKTSSSANKFFEIDLSALTVDAFTWPNGFDTSNISFMFSMDDGTDNGSDNVGLKHKDSQNPLGNGNIIYNKKEIPSGENGFSAVLKVMFFRNNANSREHVTSLDIAFDFLLGPSVISGIKGGLFQKVLERDKPHTEQQGTDLNDGISGQAPNYHLTSSSSSMTYIDFHPGDINNLEINGNLEDYTFEWSLSEESKTNFHISNIGFVEMLNPMQPGVSMTCELVGTLTSKTSGYTEKITITINYSLGKSF